MTVAVVVKTKQHHVIAADTLITNDEAKIPARLREEPSKLFTFDDSTIASVGDAHLRDIVRLSMTDLDDPAACFDTRDDIILTAQAMHRTLKKDFFLMTDNEEDKEQVVESSQFHLLIANEQGIFEIDDRRGVDEYTCYYAIGSGQDFAMAAMHAVYKPNGNALRIARKGIEAACEFRSDCGMPMTHAIYDA